MTTVEVKELEQRAQQRGRPYRVLIVDDEKWVREVFQDFCRLTHVFDVEVAGGGTEALEKVKTGAYDLITMDLIMPEMSGLEALSAIKKLAPSVPIVVITGNATEKLVSQAGVEGACKVLYKPVTLEDFFAELVSTLVR
jgi:CheY-like chemotaxis protein